jgi:hypothetical protein
VPEGKNPAASYSLIKFVVTLDSPKTRDAGRGPPETKFPMPASTSPMSSSSVLTSPSSWLLELLAAGEPPSSGGAFSGPSTIGSTGSPAAISSSVVIGLAVLFTRATCSEVYRVRTNKETFREKSSQNKKLNEKNKRKLKSERNDTSDKLEEGRKVTNSG